MAKVKATGRVYSKPTYTAKKKKERISTPVEQYNWIDELLVCLSKQDIALLYHKLKEEFLSPVTKKDQDKDYDEQTLKKVLEHLFINESFASSFGKILTGFLTQSNLNSKKEVEDSAPVLKKDATVRESTPTNTYNDLFINEFTYSSDAADRFLALSVDYDEEKEELVAIATALSKHWEQLHSYFSTIVEADKEYELVKNLQTLLSSFLEEVKNKQHPGRKRILAFLARLCNQHLSNFEFVSPEHTAVVDPLYHTVLRKEGSRIKAGLSYLVVRNPNKQVVFKANIITH